MTQKNQEKIQPRFEFRTFATDLSPIRAKMEELSGPVPKDLVERESRETYILTDHNSEINCKIREDKMDIKKLLQKRHGLEQWTVLLKKEFPLDSSYCNEHIFPALGISFLLKDKKKINLNEFLDITNQIFGIHCINVNKKRFGFSIKGVICEFALIRAAGSEAHSIAVESESESDVLEVLDLIHASEYENINYPRGLNLTIHGEL